ncbi:MAG: acyl-CoA/acyl-ACP dehydrogenase [Euryarchaeota archaeon]|nr:acyl-CoA/acyl-ACP dehydrogenase [Euryarchaeota archaeon]MDE1837120.1 acyl-CoA/acyl-ACP dehydrogenase [Euryarchaeota archaeon]MDE2045194.1 acyl-CoA/acyl-ACP dehydrogenase [Thermoplasmata archaeon]
MNGTPEPASEIDPASPFATPRAPALRKEVREFALALDLARRYSELDRHPSFPQREWKALAARGWLGPRAPTSVGGQAWSVLDEAALIEEIGFLGGSVFAKLVLQPEFCSPLLHGSPELLERWYRPLLRGELLIANQVTEPHAGSDAAALSTRAEREGDLYVISGTKSEVAFAEDAQAALVYAKTAPGEGAKGISLFLVPQDLRGISHELSEDLGEKWMRRGTVHYDHVQVPSGSRVGEEGKGFSYFMEELTPERALLGLLYLSVARASWGETRQHVASRNAFGRPLSSFEGVSFPLVEDHAQLRSARLFAWDVLARWHRHEEVSAEAALAKWLGNSTALKVLDHAMQFHGGAGYSSRLPHEQRWRDVRSGTSAHGTDEILKVVAARKLLGASR